MSSLKILIVDPDRKSTQMLTFALRKIRLVKSFKYTESLAEAQDILENDDINVIFIDPISLGLENASQFIFDIRKRLSNKVFVLYLDFSRMRQLCNFYSGERKRFFHYYKLDKLLPTQIFEDELMLTTEKCKNYLSLQSSKEKINNLQTELASIEARSSTETIGELKNILQEIQKQLDGLINREQERTNEAKPKTIFLLYRFADGEYVDGLKTLLENEGFSITTGQKANTFISRAILERIKSSEFFVCLMTKADEKKDGNFTTSPWLLEEKGAAIAMGKKIVLMVEEGVTDIGGLQGDWQRIHFTAKSFTSGAIQAVKQLNSYLKYS